MERRGCAGGWGPGGEARRIVREEVHRLLLLSLLEEGSMTRPEILLELEERSEGGLEADAGVVYPILQSLVDQGRVAVDGGGDAPPRYELTDEGRAELKRQEHRIEKFWTWARHRGRRREWTHQGGWWWSGGPGEWEDDPIQEAVEASIRSVQDVFRSVERTLEGVVDEIRGLGCESPRRRRRRRRGGDRNGAADEESS